MTNEEFKALRELKGYTQKELGQYLDMSEVQISRIENGHSDIRRVLILAMKGLPRKQ